MSTPTTQRGWPVKATTSGLVRFKWITGHVLAGAVETVLDYVCSRFHAEVEPIVKEHSWGWSYRPVRGYPNVWSEHAAAVAVDLNAPAHPMGSRGTFTAAQAASIRRIIADVDGVVSWGGDWSGRPDEMHFEIRRDPARLAAVAARIRGDKAPAPAPPAPAPPAPAPIGVRETSSVVDWLHSRGRDSSFAARAKLAAAYGISGYRGTAAQNLELLSHLRATEAQDAAAETGRTWTVTASHLNIRTGPAATYPTYGSGLPHGWKWHGTGRTAKAPDGGTWVEGRSPFMLSVGQEPQWVNGGHLRAAK